MTCPRSHSKLVAKARLELPSPGVPRPAPSSVRSLSHGSRAWAEPGLCPRECWRPGELLQTAQAGSYSQAETCRILLCTTRQQHPCAGTDRNKAHVGKALHLHFWNLALRFCFISLGEACLLLRARVWEDMHSCCLECIHSVIPQSCHTYCVAGSAPVTEDRGT